MLLSVGAVLLLEQTDVSAENARSGLHKSEGLALPLISSLRVGRSRGCSGFIKPGRDAPTGRAAVIAITVKAVARRGCTSTLSAFDVAWICA